MKTRRPIKPGQRPRQRPYRDARFARLSLGLLTILSPGLQAASAPDLAELVRQMQSLKSDYETRISRLEQQKQQDTQRIEQLEQALMSKTAQQTDKAVPTPATQGRTHHDSGPPPYVTLKNLPMPEATRSPEELPVESLESSSLNLKGAGATLIDEPNGSVPFALRTKVSLEGRYSYFGRTVSSWRPNNNPGEPINDYSIIELNRASVGFVGYALQPELVYNLMLMASTSAGSVVPLGYLGYDWLPEIKGRVGVWKAPGTREWTESWTSTLGADRTMATTYFRPNWTPGAWLEGRLAPTFDYQLFVGNSFGGSASNYEANREGTGMLYGYSGRWEPLGALGGGVSDLEPHDRPVFRLGTTGVYQDAQNSAPNGQAGNPDSTIFRLSNGTPLSLQGALGPNSQINSASVYLATLDTAFKYDGFALFAEFMYRHLDGFGYSGNAPEVSALNDYGGIFQGSYFLLPQTLEMFGRSSLVSGLYGTPWEAGGGFNWYPMTLPNWILTSEALYIQRSPAENLLTPYRAGESGVVGQVEMKFFF